MKNILTKVLLATTFFAIAVAYDSNSFKSEAREIEEGIDIQKEPLEAILKVLELGKKTGILKQEANENEATKPVSFKDLIEYLPSSPRGWTAEKPTGGTTSLGDYRVSQVNQTYVKDAKEISITIFDWTFNSALYMPFLLSTEFSQESTEGYNKGIAIDNIPGREEYTYLSKEGSINLLVNNRFFVQISGVEIEEGELREWWQKVDYKSLTKMSDRSQRPRSNTTELTLTAFGSK